MADRGAAKIKSLLNTPSASLANLMNTLQNAMSQAQNNNNLTVPSSGFSAISALRGYYRNLGNNVRSTATSSSQAKGEVLAALKQLDQSLVTLSKGLQEGTSDSAAADLATAQQQSARANTQLARASRALG